MDAHIYTIIGICSYVAILIYIGWRTGRAQNHEGFVIGNRNIGIFATAASLSVGWRDIALMTFWISFSYSNGFALTLFLPAFFILMCAMSILLPKFRTIAEERNYVTPGQMIGDYIGNKSRIIYALLIMFVGVMFGAAQLFVMGNILSATIGVSSGWTISLTAVIVCFYLLRGGYASVILTDIIQFFVVLCLLLIPIFIHASHDNITNWQSIGSLGWSEAIALCIMPFMLDTSNSNMWQRIYSARDERTVRLALPLAGLFFCILTFSLIYIGITLQDILPNVPTSELFTLIFTAQAFPPIFLSLILVVVFAMGMSTLDTWVYLFSSTMMRDFIRTSTKTSKDRYVRQTRFITSFMLLLVTFVALSYDNLVTVLMGMLSVYGVATPVFIVIIFSLLPKNLLNDIVLSLITVFSFCLFIYMQLTGQIQTFAQTLIPTGAGFILTGIWVVTYKVKLHFQD